MVQDFPTLDSRPTADRQLVEQYGAIDLRVASETGLIEGDASAAEANYNGIEDPASMLGKPDDVFAAYRMSGYMRNAGAEAPAVTPQGSAPAAEQ